MSSQKPTRPLPEARDDPRLPDGESVRAYTAALLADPAFAASARRKQLLAYIVEQTLAGRGHRLKAFDLAVAVLGRDERFDPQSDPSVRVEVGRLRRDLAHYYEADGRGDPIRITIPTGRYVPVFEVRAPAVEIEPLPASPPAPRPHWRKAAAGACLVLLVAAAALLWAPWRSGEQAQAAGPALIVGPFEGLSGGEAGQLLASGLTNGLIANLMRFDGFQLFAGTAAADNEDALPAAAARLPVYVVAGGVDREADRIRVTATLIERASGQVLWSQRYERSSSAADILDVEDELAAGIAGRLAQVYGVVSDAAAREFAEARPATLFAYDCVQRAFAYRRTFARELYPPVRACLEESVRRDPGYAEAWAMLGFAHLDATRFGFVEPAEGAAEMAAGLAAAEHAVELAPNRVRGLQAVAALRFMLGDHDEAERVQRQAIAANPNDPESMAQLGWRLSVRGRSDEGVRLLQAAIDHSLRPPPWYYANLGLALYLSGEFAAARDAADRGKDHCCGVGQSILALTEAAVGQASAAKAALDEAIRQAPIFGRDPRAFCATFGVADAVTERLMAGWAKAGLVISPEPAPGTALVTDPGRG